MAELQKSQWRAENNFVEEIAEPGFEQVDFGLGHRHALGPVVGHSPRRRIAAPRPARHPSRRPRVIIKVARRHASIFDEARTRFLCASHAQCGISPFTAA